MHVHRYRPNTSRPASAGASALVLAVIGAGLATIAGPQIAPAFYDPPLTVENIPLPTPVQPTPEPVPVQPDQIVRPTTPPLHQPDSLVKLPTAAPPMGTTTDLVPVLPDPPAPTGLGGGGVTVDPPRAPVMVGAAIDPRHADALQPPYPSYERRAGIEGAVTVRVRIDTSGRVSAVEIVNSVSEGLANATRRHALSRWRFKPATRDGIPVESWKTMTLRFTLVD